jgi:hypothetical protein
MRVEGRNTAEGYEIVQGGVVRQSYTREAAHADAKLKSAIVRNKWEPLA